MRVDQAFKRAGFEIVDAKKEGKTLTFFVRVPFNDPRVPSRWQIAMEEILLLAEVISNKPVPKWAVDVSKKYFAKNGGVRWLWRVTMTGDLAACQVAIVTATLNALRTGNELSEVPLGPGTPPPDPAAGRYKGGYRRGEADVASGLIAQAGFR